MINFALSSIPENLTHSIPDIRLKCNNIAEFYHK